MMGAQDNGLLVQVQRDVAFQGQGQGEIGPRREPQPPPLGQEADGRLEGGGVLVDPVPHRAELLYVYTAGLRPGDQLNPLFPAAVKANGDVVLAVGLQAVQRKYVGIAPEPALSVQQDGVPALGVIGRIALQLQAGGAASTVENLYHD